MPGTRAVEVNGQNFCKPSQNSQRPGHTQMQYNRTQDLIKSQDTKGRISSASVGQQRLEGRGLITLSRR